MPSSRFIFSRSRSVTSRRSREFSTWSSLMRVVCSIGEVFKSALCCDPTTRLDGARAFRHRWYVITLIPSALAISPWSRP